LRFDPWLRVGIAMKINDSHGFHLSDEEGPCQFAMTHALNYT
jgi:hypothetical protein